MRELFDRVCFLVCSSLKKEQWKGLSRAPEDFISALNRAHSRLHRTWAVFRGCTSLSSRALSKPAQVQMHVVYSLTPTSFSFDLSGPHDCSGVEGSWDSLMRVL